MADFDSGFPIRTQVPGQVDYNDVVVKIGDGTVPTQQLTVNLDGSVNVTDNGGSLTVDGVDFDIRDLDAAQDNVAISDGTDTLAINADGSLNITDNGGSITVDAVNLDIRDLVFATDKVDVSGSVVALDAGTLAALESITVQNGAGAAAVNIQDGGNSITVDDGGGSITVDGTVTVTATDLDIRDLTHVSDSVKIGDGTDFLAINADGSINVIPQEDPGTEVVNYDLTSAVAAGATDNHDFLVTTGGRLYQVMATASGRMRAEVQIETGSATNVFNTVMVGFNSTANPNMNLQLAKYATIPTGARVRVIRRNSEPLAAQDVYSTIVLISN